MTKYNVHLYREMRLFFPGIEAETPEAAAQLVCNRPTDEADDIEDCDGETLSALVDVAGDETYEHSVTIDFETERQHEVAPALLAALEAVLPYADNECRSLDECWKRDGDLAVQQAAEACGRTIAEARAAISAAQAGEVAADAPRCRFEMEHEPLENPGRAYVMVDDQFDVAILRADGVLRIDVYPKDWIDPIDTLTVWDEEAAELEPNAAKEP